VRCFNCNHELPQNAKFCPVCEAPVEPEPTAEELDAVRAALENLPPDLMAQFHKVISESATAEEFADRILVGDCPTCGSSQTGDCENDPDINAILIGRCYDCGQLFCTECGRLMKPNEIECECWDDLDWDETESPDSDP
jgi:hypothetical protein